MQRPNLPEPQQPNRGPAADEWHGVEPTGSAGFGDEQGRPRRPRRPRRRRSVRTRIIGWSALVVVAALVIVGGYAGYSYFRFVGGVSHVDVIAKSAQAAGRDENILLVGDDHRPAGASAAELAQLGTTQDGGGTNTDTMMILHIPADGNSATVISLPRDSWVSIPGHGKDKLNAAFGLGGGANGDPAGGAKLLIQTVQNLTGLTINHWVRVSLLGFYNIAQALGPIQVCLNHAVDDPYSQADFPAGVSTLNAHQALAFVRQRHGLPRGDLDRVVRQQYFLSVEAHKFLSAGTLLNPAKLSRVLDAVSSSLETDPGLNFLTLAAQLRGLTGGRIHSATIPISGTPTIYVRGRAVSVVQVDMAAMPAFTRSLLGGPSAPETAAAAQPSTVHVTVLNGGSRRGAAGDATRTLARSGFITGTPGNAATTAQTVIQYPPGQDSQAKAVAERLPGATVVQSATVSTVTLVLGTDGLMPTAAAGGTNATRSTTAPTTANSPAATSARNSPAQNYNANVCID